jgi:hypothetical protein
VLPKYGNYIPLYEKLREDQLVSDDLDAVLSTFHPKRTIGQLLYTLNDTFFVDFGADKRDYSIITEQGVKVLPLFGPFNESRMRRRPYTGAYTSHHLLIVLD